MGRNVLIYRRVRPLRTAIAIGLALVTVPAAGRAQQPCEPSPPSLCGPAPRNIVVTRSYQHNWTTAQCSAQNLAAGVSLPTKVPVPATFSLSDDERSCSSAGSNAHQSEEYLSAYLATDTSLLLAECGYRQCELQRAGASSGVIDSYARVCAGALKLSNLSPFGSIGNADGFHLVGDPLRTFEWHKDKVQDVPLTFVGNPDVAIAITISESGPKGHQLKRATLPPKQQKDVVISIPMGSTPPPRGEPQSHRLHVEYAGNLAFDVVVSFYSRATLKCSHWTNDQCVRCDFDLASSEGEFNCPDMPPNARATFSFVGSAKDAASGDAEEDIQAIFTLEPDPPGRMASYCNTGGGTWAGTPCVAPFSGVRGSHPVALEAVGTSDAHGKSTVRVVRHGSNNHSGPADIKLVGRLAVEVAAPARTP